MVTTQKGFEIYDYIKEYVDIVQEENFEIYYEPIKVSRYQKSLKNGLIVERWAMFFIFYFYFNEKYFRENIKSIRKLVTLLHKNCVVTLELWSEALTLTPAFKIESQKLRAALAKKQIKNTASDMDMNAINQNNNYIISIFKASLQYLSPEIKSGIIHLQQNLDKLSLKDGLDLCLDAFCQFLIEKGVVSVEYTQDNTLKAAHQNHLGTANQSSSQKTQLLHQSQSKTNGHTNAQKENTPKLHNQNAPNHQAPNPQAHTSGASPQDTSKLAKKDNLTDQERRQKLVNPAPPFLPASEKSPYTLVMDLDETLVHYEDNGVTGQFYLRPYAQEYLDEMSKYYEIVIFTAALQDYADWILNRLDTNDGVHYR